MKVRFLVIAIVFGAALVMPSGAQVRPGDAEQDNVLDVIAQHDATTEANAYFGTVPEFAQILSREENIALFVPHDDALTELDPAELTADRLVDLFNAHVALGLAARTPVELIVWFSTADGSRVDVTVEDDTVMLNGEITVVEAIAATNGIVYIIDGPLEPVS